MKLSDFVKVAEKDFYFDFNGKNGGIPLWTFSKDFKTHKKQKRFLDCNILSIGLNSYQKVIIILDTEINDVEKMGIREERGKIMEQGEEQK